MDREKLKEIKENIKLFLQGAFDMKDRSTALIRKEALDELDNFMLLCFGDLLGFPLPTSYYTLEILPYIAEDLDGWERRLLNRKSVVSSRWGDFDN